MQNDRDVSNRTLCFQDDSSREPGVPEHSYGDTSFRDVPSHHLIYAGPVEETYDGVMGCPDTMGTRPNFLGPLPHK